MHVWGCRRHRSRGEKQARRAGELSLAVDQETALRGDLVAGFQPGADDVEIVPGFVLDPRTERERSEFEAQAAVTLALGKAPGDVADAGREHGRLGHEREARGGRGGGRIRDIEIGPDFNVADSTSAASAARFTLVPKAAVLSTGVRHVAWRLAERQGDGRLRFELAPLALGPRIEDEAGNDLYVVRAGLKPGDEVAAQGSFLIDSQAQLAGTASLLFPAGAVTPAAPHVH